MTPLKYFTLVELTRSRIAQERKIRNDLPEALIANADRTLAGLDRIRGFLGYPMTLSSGYRCPELNHLVGGVSDSQHVRAEAADFTCPAFGTPEAIVAALHPHMAEFGIDQLIMEGTWVHVSFSLEPRTQALRLVKGGGYVAWKPIG